MTIVEHLYRGFQWAEPPQNGGELEVNLVGSDLQISGLYPRYKIKDAPSDLIRRFERASKDPYPTGLKRIGKESPDVQFANAVSDEQLITFVRRFGPVVAKSVRLIPPIADEELGQECSACTITALQDMQELRNEQLIYRAALHLVILSREGQHSLDSEVSRPLLREISDHVGDWLRQWERERSQDRFEPVWRFNAKSLRIIEHMAAIGGGFPYSPIADARIVICELLNSFRSTVFPDALALHGSILCGIRPLLYSLLRRQFLHPRDSSVCANTQCRNFFNIERAGQQFCSAECSQQQRQRNYWKKRGKKLRKARSKRQKTIKR
jgi:hypothetical protein